MLAVDSCLRGNDKDYGLKQQLHALRQAEACLVQRYQQRVLQAFLKSLTLQNVYTLQSLPDTLNRLWHTGFYPALQRHRALLNHQSEHRRPLTDGFLNRHLPYRARMLRTSAGRRQYETALLSLMQRFRFFRVIYFPAHCIKVPSTDFSSHLLFCGQVLELLHNRPDLVDHLLHQKPHGFHVQFCHELEQTYFDPGYIQINPLTLWMDSTADRSPGVMHVCLHLLSQTDTDIQTDTIFDMDPVQRQALESLKQHLEAIAHQRDFSFWGKVRLLLTGKPRAGVHPYAFFKPMPEFLSMTVENCMKTPEQVVKTEAGQALLQFFKAYFRWDIESNAY